MSSTLYELLRRDVKRMINAMDINQKGNIHPLVIKEIEKYLIDVVLEETNNNYARASQILGISRSTLYRKIESINKKTNKK